MGTTVIDQLIVKLGLDPADFTKGEKQVAASVLKTESTVKGANQRMGNDFAAMAKKFLGAAAVIAGLRKLVGALADVSTQTRRLGMDANNFRISAAELRNWENAAEMMGGKAEDVTKSVEGLQKAVYDLTVNGQLSPQLEMLARLGVQFQDTTGKARSFHDIVVDTADALERAQKNGTLNRTEAYFAAQQAGFDEGTTQLILSGRANLERELARQQARHQVNAEDVAAATTIERGRAEVAQRAQSAAVQANSVAVAGAGQVKGAYDAAVSKTTDAMEGLANAAKRAGEALSPGSISDSLTHRMPLAKRREKYAGTVARAAGKYGIDPALLSGLLEQESQYDPTARSNAGAVGIAQFMPKTAASRGFTPGKDAHQDIMEAAKYLSELHGSAVAKGLSGQAAWDEALRYYNGGIGRVQSSRAGGKPLADETINYPGLVRGKAARADPLAFAGAAGATPAATRGAGTTTVNVGPVSVNTAATDAEGIAADMNGAVQRKMAVAQADTGMQ